MHGEGEEMLVEGKDWKEHKETFEGDGICLLC